MLRHNELLEVDCYVLKEMFLRGLDQRNRLLPCTVRIGQQRLLRAAAKRNQLAGVLNRWEAKTATGLWSLATWLAAIVAELVEASKMFSLRPLGHVLEAWYLSVPCLLRRESPYANPMAD